MRRRAPSQTWTLTRVHRVLRPLRTKVSALATALNKERRSTPPANTSAPTPTPTKHRPPLRRTYQTRRKRKRGDGPESEDEDYQDVPKPVRPSKSKSKPSGKQERRWSPELLERIAAVVDAFRVLADVVYDEQVELEGEGGSILRLRDMCVRALAADIEPSAVAAAGLTEDDSDDEGELVDATMLVDHKFEEIPEHLRRGAIIPYALSMIKQHIDSISPLPQLWNHILAICLSSSAAPSPSTAADALQICSNLFFASLHQPRSGSRGLAGVYRNITGTSPDKISTEIFCQTFLAILTPQGQYLEDHYDLPADFGTSPQLPPRLKPTQSPHRTPARRRSFVPPTPPTYDPSADLDDPTGTLFPIRSLLSRSVAHLVAELGPTELLAFVETAAGALQRWTQTDHYTALMQEREFTSQRKVGDVRSLAPRLCARISDWVPMVLAEVWSRPIDISALEKAASALGKVVEATLGESDQAGTSSGIRQNSVDRQANKGTWLDVADPFCALTCVYLAKQLNPGTESSNLVSLLYRLPLTARNCNILLGTLGGLPGDDENTPRPIRRFSFPRSASPDPTSLSIDPAPIPRFTQALWTYTCALSSANCPHLEATLLQLVVNDRPYVEHEVEEMLEEAEARWDSLDSSDPLQFDPGEPLRTTPLGGDVERGWKWARWRWRWDEITNTWVERDKPISGDPVPVVRPKFVKKKAPRPKEVIAISSDTEVGRDEGQDEDVVVDDSDDGFDAIPTPKYTNRRLGGQWSPIKTRRQSMGKAPVRSRTASSDGEYQETRRNASRSARPTSTFDWDESDSGSETVIEGTSESDSESDFDWTQYNSNYHPHDRRVSTGDSAPTRRLSARGSSDRPERRLSQRNSSDQENRAVQRVVSAPVPAPAVKRQRLVVELPTLGKRRSLFFKPTVLGSHNAPCQDVFGSYDEPRQSLSFAKPKPKPISKPKAVEITTSTLERLCSQFTQLSSDDDRDMVVDVDDDEISGTDGEDEVSVDPSSDDMDLFQIVTPAPRRVRPLGTRD